MSKILKNYTTIRTALSQEEWSARSLRVCFLLMPWQDGIEVTDELMKAVVGWEGKLNNFFLNSLDLWRTHKPTATTAQVLGVDDRELLSVLEKAKADVNAALCDSFNTSAVMRIISNLVTEYNSAESLSDQTVVLLAQWVTRIVIIFGLDSEGDLKNPDRIGWSDLDIPEPAKPYIYALSQLRDKIRNMALSGSVDHAAITELADGTVAAESIPISESSKSYDQKLQRFRNDVKALTAQQSSAKDLLTLCDQLRDVHLWNLGIYLEDRANSKPALVRPLDDLLKVTRAERESAGIARANAKLEQEAKEAEKRKELNERARVDPVLMFRTSGEYSEWDENGIPTRDAASNVVSRNRRKKLVKDWEKQKERHEQWLSTQRV